MTYRKVCMLYVILKVHKMIILNSSAVEHSAVNRGVVGSSPTWGALKSAKLFNFFK